MKKLIAPLFADVLLTGCSIFFSPIPENYNGPVAVIKDSVKPYSPSKADFFYLSHVDGKRIEDSDAATWYANYGRGGYMSNVVLDRKVPAQASVFKIVGQTVYSSVILTLANDVYEVSGEVKFTPEKDKTYVVKGELGNNYSAVWIEDAATKSVVGEKIVVNGSAKAGLFQKW
jgi:hypothetical protein